MTEHELIDKWCEHCVYLGLVSESLTPDSKGLERVKIGAVNAAILAHGQLVAPFSFTASAHGFNGPVREEGVEKVFHGVVLGNWESEPGRSKS